MLMIIVALVVLGLCLGSFTNALVWRLHEQEKHNGQLRKELSILRGRSMCPNCHHQLVAKDLVPLFSWLSLRGKCRYCGQPISWQYPVVEAALAALFVFAYIYWPAVLTGVGLLSFIIWLALLTLFLAMIVYDLRWYLLPDKLVLTAFILAVVEILASVVFFHKGNDFLVSRFWGLIIGGGLFFVLFQLSQGKWIGGGDVKLGSVLGLLVGGPANALLFLFIASASGSLVSVPLLSSGKLKRDSRIPFGPFLILASVLVKLFGDSLVNWMRNRALIP